MQHYYIYIFAIVIVACFLTYSIYKFFNIKPKNRDIAVKKITGCAVLTTVEIVMIIISNYISIGPVNMNLSLVPIALGALLYGPWVGAILGLVNGVITILSPYTGLFLAISPLGTVVVCLLKTSLAGFTCGMVYKLFEKKHSFLGTFVSSLLVPIINTGLFIVGCYIFFSSWVIQGSASYSNQFTFFLMGVLGWNFLFEVLISTLLAPTVHQIVKVVSKKYIAR